MLTKYSLSHCDLRRSDQVVVPPPALVASAALDLARNVLPISPPVEGGVAGGCAEHGTVFLLRPAPRVCVLRPRPSAHSGTRRGANGVCARGVCGCGTHRGLECEGGWRQWVHLTRGVASARCRSRLQNPQGRKGTYNKIIHWIPTTFQFPSINASQVAAPREAEMTFSASRFCLLSTQRGAHGGRALQPRCRAGTKPTTAPKPTSTLSSGSSAERDAACFPPP